MIGFNTKSFALVLALVPAQTLAAPACGDDAEFKFNLDKGNEQDCAWLNNSKNTDERIAKYCNYGNVKWACQATCTSCAATCADSSTSTFTTDNGATVDCAWLLQSSKDATDIKRTGLYCNRGDEETSFEVGFECPESCGFCPV